MSGHTFSNWKVAEQTPSRVDTPDGSISVSWSSNADGGERDRKAESAARLIAAAPELLDALKDVMTMNKDFYEEGDNSIIELPQYCAAWAAIAKATGGSE